MTAVRRLKHKFVELIPNRLENETIYVSFAYATAVHKCCCGCGNEVVTPLTPTDWRMTFDGESISLDPSIGNWSFDCKSHYWIENSVVHWAPQMSRKQIEAGRARDRSAKKEYFESRQMGRNGSSSRTTAKSVEGQSQSNFWAALRKWWS